MVRVDEKKKKLKLKSAMRKPLRDLSNHNLKPSTSSTSTSSKKNSINNNNKNGDKTQPEHEPDVVRVESEDPLDRLLLAHSDFSSLLRQIDELVVQAVMVNTTDNNKAKEIKSFANVLSEIHSSVKPSVLKLQKVLAIEPETPMAKPETSVSFVDEGDENEPDTPEPTKQESLVSPSPLVSWRATDCTIQRGKQLFLLTPLPRPRTAISKTRASFKSSVSEGITFSCATAAASALCSKAESFTQNVESTTGLDASSLNIPPIGDDSAFFMTPCPKIPPLSSCAVVEPDRKLDNKKVDKPRLSTPFPVGNRNFSESTDSESSSGEISEKLGLKYPELFGIKPSYMRNGSKALEASPAWTMSPPKCCTLLEPHEEKLVKDVQEIVCDFDQKITLSPTKEDGISNVDHDREKGKSCIQGNFWGNFATVESTPSWKGPESTIHKGKRPGENTLKKELWTRFEAASTGGFHLDLCVSQDTSQKGFLDRLEEASSDEASPNPDSLR